MLQAQEETEEAIQTGNHRYNSMLHESMNTQDDLAKQIAALKLDVSGKAGEMRDLDSQMKLLRKESEEAQGRQLKSWEEERRAAAQQKEQVWRSAMQHVLLLRYSIVAKNDNMKTCLHSPHFQRTVEW